MRQNLTSSKQDRINQYLLYAVQNGNMELCQTLLEQGANPNIRDGLKTAALHYAAKNNHTAICLKLLETIEDVNLQDSFERTALHYAAENGNIELFESLIKQNANPNVRDELKSTALHYASENDGTAICLKLLETIEDVNLQDSFEKTALHYAAENGNIELLEALIKQNANPNIRDKFKRTALHYAAKNNHTDACLILLEVIEDVNLQDTFERAALHCAAENGNSKVCQILLEQGANPNIRDNSKKTALHYAAKNNHTDACLKLLEAIEDVNLQDSFERTALHYAAENGNLEVFEALIDKAVNPNITDCLAKTALGYVVENNNVYLTACLISEGASPLYASSNSTLAHIQTAASRIYQAKLGVEKLLIEEIIQQVNEYLIDKLPVTLEGDSLSNIFAAIKKEIRDGYCDVDKIEKLYEILVPHLEDIESNDGVTTGRFKHFFRKNLQDFTEWSINMRMSYMIGSHLDNFQEGNAKLESAIPGAVMSHVSSFLPISGLTSLGQVSPRAGYQKTTSELQDYQAYLSQKYKDKKIIVRDKFFNEVILPLAKRQNLPELEPRQETDHSITPITPKEQPRSQAKENDRAEVEDVVSSMVQAVVDRSNVEISSQLQS